MDNLPEQTEIKVYDASSMPVPGFENADNTRGFVLLAGTPTLDGKGNASMSGFSLLGAARTAPGMHYIVAVLVNTTTGKSLDWAKMGLWVRVNDPESVDFSLVLDGLDFSDAKLVNTLATYTFKGGEDGILDTMGLGQFGLVVMSYF